MVFCGKPSRACERCRTRRLRCDFQKDVCGQCTRASVPCIYRCIPQLRIKNESQSVAEKVSSLATYSNPKSLPLSIDIQAWEAFFAYYVHGTCWDFLRIYHHPTDCPGHLSAAIEAVSLAYLWHQQNSDAALIAARQHYMKALRMTNKALKCSTEATKDTTLAASLLLDLFEKITDSQPWDNKAWTSHMNGALALVRVRGLEKFQEPSGLRILQRMSSNFITSYIASWLPVPDEITAIRDYVGQYSDTPGPMQRYSDLIIRYASLRSNIRRGVLREDEYIEAFKELDTGLQGVECDMPVSWQYTIMPLKNTSDRIFGFYYDSYPHRNICLAWNILRAVRFLLNETLARHYLALPTDENSSAVVRSALQNIKTLTKKICASVPQYIDCDGVARSRLPTSEKPESLGCGSHKTGHLHTPNHQADCYTLLLPLYIAGRAETDPEVRPWVVKQLHYIGSHFYIRNAEVIAQLLEQATDVCPWQVYAMLGSYAFTV